MTPQIKERIEKISRGEVPEGYKKTVIGIIPNDWEVVSIKDNFLALSTNTLSRDNLNTQDGYFSNIHYGDILVKYSEIVDCAKDEIPFVNDDVELSRFDCLEDGDIIFADTAEDYTVGKAIEIINSCGKNVVSGLHTIAFRPQINFSRKWLGYFLNSDCYHNQLLPLATGTKVTSVSKSNFNTTYVVRPSNEVQEKITDILTAQDKVIELKEKIIEEKKIQKKCFMQQLLTGKKRLKGFEDDWEKINLSDILYERKTFCKKGEEYPHVTLCKDGVCPKTDRYDRDHLVKDEEKEYKITYKGDICYNPANLKFGVICENTFGDGIFSPIYVTYEVSPEVDRAYISHYLMRWDFINAVRKYEEGTVYERMAVKSSDFLKYSFKIPSLEEQKAISKVLSTVDEEIELLQQELEQEKQKKKALMQLLLTGIVRVKGEQ